MVNEVLQTVFEDSSKDGKINPAGVKKWFKEANIIGKVTEITEEDVDAAIAMVSKDMDGLDLSGLLECLNILAKEKKVDPEDLIDKLEIDATAKAANKLVEQFSEAKTEL